MVYANLFHHKNLSQINGFNSIIGYLFQRHVICMTCVQHPHCWTMAVLAVCDFLEGQALSESDVTGSVQPYYIWSE